MDDAESLTSDAELEDLDERPGFDVTRIDASLLNNPVVVRACAGIAVATLILLWPDRSDRILARLIAVAIVVISATSLWSALRSRPRRLPDVLFAAAGIAVALWLLASPSGSEVALARLVGLVIIAMAARDLFQLVRGADGESRTWVVSRSLALLGAGLLLIAFPSDVFAASTTLVATGWILVSALVIVISLDANTEGVTDYKDTAQLIGDWLAERPKSVDDRQALHDKILFEGPSTRRRVIRFLTLMAFASVIASMGVITDSTAVVIGAMLIAPLMTPLMGMAVSLVMGWPHRLTRSALTAASGIVVAIGIGVFLGLSVPAVIDTANNSQILARSSPTVLDLIIAVAAGAAGAFGLSRPDVSDSLPGVAIAISLVPPLAVVGIAYSQGDWSAGNGALLLFATNTLAILVIGGITFVFTGITPIRRVAENQHRVRTAVGAVATLCALVLGALMLNGTQIASDLVNQSSTEDAVKDWLAEYPEYSLIAVDLDGDTVTATVVGPSSGAPTAASMADEVSESLDRAVTADLRLVVQERDVATSED